MKTIHDSNSSAGRQSEKAGRPESRLGRILARWPACLLACFGISALMLPILALYAADITPGYTFTSGEKNVTHTKLNNAAAGTINTTFVSGKSSAGADPNTAWTVLIHDTSTDVFRKGTLQQTFFDHTALLGSRTAKTAPALADTVLLSDSAAGGAYKQMSWTNFFFGGTAPGLATNETRLPALLGGAPGSVTVSNLWFSTNRIDGVSKTNTTLATNDALVTLQAGELKKLFLLELRDWLKTSLMSSNVVQSRYTGTTNLATTGSGNWSNVTVIGTSSLSNAITPRAASSRILVRVVLQASYTSTDSGAMRVVRDGTAIGVGDSDGANRIEACAGIGNVGADAVNSVVWEWLDSPATTSTVSYWVQVTGPSGNTILINRSVADTNNDGHARTVSTLTLTEVLQ